MQESSFLPSEEPQEQHQGEGAQGKLWRLKKILRQLSRRSKYVQEYQFLSTEEPQGQHQGDLIVFQDFQGDLLAYYGFDPIFK